MWCDATRDETRRQLNRYSQAAQSEGVAPSRERREKMKREREEGGRLSSQQSQLGFGWILDHAIISLAFGMQIFFWNVSRESV